MYPTLESSVNEILSASWAITDGKVVPETEDIVLRNGGRLIEAAYLYADLAGSSNMASSLLKETTAKIIRAYINTASRILREYNGEIRSFDGDRVMAIFMGDGKETRAVRAALAINGAVLEVIRPAIEKNWSDGTKFCNINHGIGIDTGEALIVRGGVRDNNDLISIGVAPNRAAKLSEIRDAYPISITPEVFKQLSDEVKTWADGSSFWTVTSTRNEHGFLENLYRSTGWWLP